MEAWERNLQKNPNLKAWAEANPLMASKEQVKFNRKNPQKEITIPAYHETLKYLSKFNPPIYVIRVATDENILSSFSSLYAGGWGSSVGLRRSNYRYTHTA